MGVKKPPPLPFHDISAIICSMKRLLSVLMVFGVFLVTLTLTSKVDADYGDFDGVWAGTIKCNDPDLGLTDREVAIEIDQGTVSLHGYEDNTLGDLEVF